MSFNKAIRQLIERKYGKICMMEEAGIRYIPVEERRKILIDEYGASKFWALIDNE